MKRPFMSPWACPVLLGAARRRAVEPVYLAVRWETSKAGRSSVCRKTERGGEGLDGDQGTISPIPSPQRAFLHHAVSQKEYGDFVLRSGFRSNAA